MNVSQVLNAAADLIEPEGAWFKGNMAANARGEEYDDAYESVAPDAVCFCAIGAIERVTGGGLLEARAIAYLGKVVEERAGISIIPDWNDAPERTQHEVVAVFREAAKRAGAGRS